MKIRIIKISLSFTTLILGVLVVLFSFFTISSGSKNSVVNNYSNIEELNKLHYIKNPTEEIIKDESIFIIPVNKALGLKIDGNQLMGAYSNPNYVYDILYTKRDLIVGKWAEAEDEMMITKQCLLNIGAMHNYYQKNTGKYDFSKLIKSTKELDYDNFSEKLTFKTENKEYKIVGVVDSVFSAVVYNSKCMSNYFGYTTRKEMAEKIDYQTLTSKNIYSSLSNKELTNKYGEAIYKFNYDDFMEDVNELILSNPKINTNITKYEIGLEEATAYYSIGNFYTSFLNSQIENNHANKTFIIYLMLTFILSLLFVVNLVGLYLFIKNQTPKECLLQCITHAIFVIMVIVIGAIIFLMKYNTCYTEYIYFENIGVLNVIYFVIPALVIEVVHAVPTLVTLTKKRTNC